MSEPNAGSDAVPQLKAEKKGEAALDLELKWAEGQTYGLIGGASAGFPEAFAS